MALQKGVAQAIPIPMYDALDHVTLLAPTSPTVTISKDGGALAPPESAFAVALIADFGVLVTLSAADMNANSIAIKATDADCDDAAMTVLTEADWTAARAELLNTIPEDVDVELSAIHGLGSWESGAFGTGTFNVTLLVKDDNGDPVAGARVTVAGLAPQTSNANGLFPAQWALDAGTYTVSVQVSSRYVAANPYSLTVDATGVVTAPAGGVIVVAVVSSTSGVCMNFGQLCGQVQTAMAEWLLSKESLHTVFKENVQEWVQQAIYRLDADLLWTQLRIQLDSVISQRRYTLDPGILRIQYVTYAGAELTALTTAEEIARAELDTTASTPRYYAWYGQELALYPTPAVADDEIEVWALQTPLAMVGDSDVPTLPCHLSALLVDYAMYQAFRHVGDIERAQACLAIYLEAMERDRQNYLNSRGVTAVRRDGRVT